MFPTRERHNDLVIVLLMANAAQYHRLAQECLDIAVRADPKNREKLQRVAEIWLRLAMEELVAEPESKTIRRCLAERRQA
jgi:hypothetical protein